MSEQGHRTLHPIIVESWQRWIERGSPRKQLTQGGEVEELTEVVAGLLANLAAEQARAERYEAALRTLVEAVTDYAWNNQDYRGQYATQEALEQARAALPGGDAEGGE